MILRVLFNRQLPKRHLGCIFNIPYKQAFNKFSILQKVRSQMTFNILGCRNADLIFQRVFLYFISDFWVQNYKVRFIVRMKLFAALLLLALAHLTISGTLVNTPSPHSSASYPAPPSGSIPVSRNSVSRSVTATIIDAEIRDTYWYYLPGAYLTYVAHIDSHDGCLFLHLYKNYVGTFLAIANYLDLDDSVTINTFVRVGEGCTDYAAISSPVAVQSFVISLNLGDGEYFVPHDQHSQNFNFTEGWARNKWFKNKREYDRVHQSCQKVDAFIRQQYWYYLTPDTKTLDFSESNPGSGCYCSFTYINYVGLFQVIGQWDFASNSPRVNTFVRLGDGSDPNSVTKCTILPSVS